MKPQDIGFSECFKEEVDQCLSAQLQTDMRMQVVSVLGFLGKKQKEKMDKELESVGLTGTQVQIMLYILRCNLKDIKVTAKDLEDHFRVKNSTISGILKRLEKKDMIERFADENDRRNKQIRIKGSFPCLCGDMDRQVKEELTNMFDGFSGDELTEMHRLLLKLLHNID